MAHELEIVNGKARMAYNGDVPWHGLGVDVSGKQLSPQQMLEVSGNNWKVFKVPATAKIRQLVSNQAEIDKIIAANSKKSPSKRKAVPELKTDWRINDVTMKTCPLVRDIDGKIMDEVTTDWNPVQNEEAMEFFNDFVAAGEMEMETVGSLKGGEIVWGLAAINESFELFKGDKVKGYLLLSNFHKYGYSTSALFTNVRVVCNNTFTEAMGENADNIIKYSHRRKWNPEHVKEMLGIAKHKLAAYKEHAAFLGSKKAKNEDIVEYLKRLMPGSVKTDQKGKKLEDTLATNARWAYDIIDVQPGNEFAKGSWWQPFNAVTFFLDHEISRTPDQRMKQAWYGTHRTIKQKALKLALEYANG